MTYDAAVEQRITTPCPSCGSRTLFIGAGGHLICSLLGCKDPSMERAHQAALDEIARLTGQIYALASVLFGEC